ncbi:MULTISPECIES: S-type pyocin domain-containing protein [unclassified Pseudomonas]|uniref:S-type pyocin domain-containing protein n=1 Tax=unclassified Pseudomonas TaxID=196821 RepID=UPI002AC961E5|nr:MULTISPECIES: S-type pyocin domain-containing protein [unclassified Pseudomonas]MEB0044891.1 S-type pyocin domain-containing protein [Pseudomonas sp. Dout3]MEB0096142.1 S-type pyocin domain-containing protein [Pseudomonas sp. DC1.2]WPX59455.1 S-type pyocin domain-containing protein [Pseudomonas sp. DC1.2]
MFAKPCALPDGEINYSNPGGYVPLDLLKDYGAYAVLGGSGAASATGTALQWVGGSGSASELAKRLGGTLAAMAPTHIKVLVGVLLPNTTSADSAFYTSEQYAQLTEGNTRVRLNVKQLPDGSVDLYGFYTGTKTEWQRVPVITATPEGDQLVADMGDGIKITWTPAVDPSSVMGIPALEGVTLKPAVWVFPPTENAAKILVNPIYPPDYQDAIIWFPSQPQIAPIYLSLSARYEPGGVTGIGKDVSGIWLAGAGTGLGSPIPTRIADKLRGREFSSFDRFREAFWEEVARDAALLSQFKPNNQALLLKGNSPYAPKTERNGENTRHEIHHIEHIQHGGAVYDVDNLSVMTPKRHAEIHKEYRKQP